MNEQSGYKYYSVIQYYRLDDKDDFPSDKRYKAITFNIGRKMFDLLNEIALEKPFNEFTIKEKDLLEYLTKKAISTFGTYPNIRIVEVFLEDFYYEKKIGSRWINKPVYKEMLYEDDSYIFEWYNDDDNVNQCVIKLNIENDIILGIKSIRFYEIVDGEKQAYRTMYRFLLSYLEDFNF